MFKDKGVHITDENICIGGGTVHNNTHGIKAIEKVFNTGTPFAVIHSDK